ncbi:MULTISPECIES: DUF397 domain-containing protein [Streptomyces]|uniref:DUF397 domain-containing protein n=1 Tax=Streptomyces thermoviolaceus subsp. thermoviolaceus TaxID=66860 RepID=A0ABX0YSD6_STRTL|nr:MULTISPECIES: DUF397 domain-containing protein [Streptomyces]MCM3264925.1 DUF397 domain-containing protein [Streptomyces thermoviolaceus]NJP15491.1 DUF397 domain-containing protein [Streptomyces thermoviolaceus subsp. thermoviolaceus]RSR96372.1 DUF397 domain-containing protein [Streptomyces sp. WAC00469]WTD50952.1 DUF397 domain-containing protein [Streptomyces thermoviolaceus]
MCASHREVAARRPRNTEQSQAQRLSWVKSSYSGGEGGECVEVAVSPGSVHIRDSKGTGRGFFTVSQATWSALSTTPVAVTEEH